MLLELRIANLALIRQAEVQFGPGLNVLTGETGAGKSILISALGLLTGERAATEHVGTEPDGPNGQADGTATARAARALVEGCFDVSQAPRAARFLVEQEIPTDDHALVVSREISSDGRSRVRLNGRLATAATLRELGGLLVDLHGQHEHQLLLRVENHIGFLDAFGDARHLELREATRGAHARWRAAERRFAELTGSEQQRAQRLDILQFQAAEIDEAAPQPEEDVHLGEERTRLLNTEKLRMAAARCREALDGEENPGAVALAAEALKAAREIASVDSAVAEWLEELESAVYALQDAAAQALDYAATLEADPRRLDEIESRLHLLSRLKRKYGESIPCILEYRAGIQEELANLTLSETELAELRAAADGLEAQFQDTAQALSASRRDLATRFDREVLRHLRSLAMEKARFETKIERAQAQSAAGIDEVEFLLCANPGQPLRPLARIASGGEISRVMLALRSVLSTASDGSDEAIERIPVLVFDEIDSGIGGVTADAVGEKMQELARHFQVFCVTHLPQIARRADRHLRVAKESDDLRTVVTVTRLEGEERVRELARMLGRETEATLRHARELLEG